MDQEDFLVKIVNEDGRQMELSDVNWQQLRELQEANATPPKISLEIQILDPKESSKYEDDDFEEAVLSEDKPKDVYKDAIKKEDIA